MKALDKIHKDDVEIDGQMKMGITMNCQKVQSCVPDLHTGDLSLKVRLLVMKHLAQCSVCRDFADSWNGFCRLGNEASLPPADLDWSAFDRALEAAFRVSPLLACRRFDWGGIWTYLTRELWNYPRRSALRWATAGSFAVILLLGATQIEPRQHEPVLHSNLTIGEMITTYQEDGKVYYSGSAFASTFHEEIDLAGMSRPTSASR